MIVPQTQSSDMKTLEELEWKITPLNITVSMVEPPAASIELTEVAEEKALPGDIAFVPPPSRRNIDMRAHKAILEESLAEYKDIWRTLAQK